MLRKGTKLCIKATCIMHAVLFSPPSNGGKVESNWFSKLFPYKQKMSSLEDFSVHISPRRAENPFLGKSGLLWTSTTCYWVAEQSSSQKISVLSLFIEEVIQSLKDHISCFHSQERKPHSYLSTRINPWDNNENLAIQLARKTLPNFCARSYKTLI